MLSIRVNGKDRRIATRKATLLDVANSVRDALSEVKRERRLAANVDAVAEAARAGDVERMRRLARRLVR